MRVIAPIPKQFEDSNGVPYANGKVTVYLHGSTSLARIYQEAEGDMLAPNPTILDSHGAWNAFVNGGTAYDYVVQDEHDNVIFSYSNVSVSGIGAAAESIYEMAMFDLSQAGHNLYGDIDSDLGKGLLPIIAAGSQGAVRYYYYTARDSQAHTMTFTCGYNDSVELLVLKNDDTYEFTSIAKFVPLVRVKYQNGAWSKISGDDGFIKNNPSNNQPSFYLPESGWYQFNITLSMSNHTPRDLVQHLQLKWEWAVFIAEGVPPATYDEPNLPSLTHKADYTSTWTINRSASSLYHKDSLTMNWLGFGLTAYGDTLPNDIEYAVFIDIFKVRDA